METIIMQKKKKKNFYKRESSGRVFCNILEKAVAWETAGKRERGGGMRERNALPIDYLTHISTSDL